MMTSKMKSSRHGQESFKARFPYNGKSRISYIDMATKTIADKLSKLPHKERPLGGTNNCKGRALTQEDIGAQALWLGIIGKYEEFDINSPMCLTCTIQRIDGAKPDDYILVKWSDG